MYNYYHIYQYTLSIRLNTVKMDLGNQIGWKASTPSSSSSTFYYTSSSSTASIGGVCVHVSLDIGLVPRTYIEYIPNMHLIVIIRYMFIHFMK
jgi:hypothetical protein